MTTTEYGIAEDIAGKLFDLPQCGSWYTDRYYADDLTGRAAAQAALGRVAAEVPGVYQVVELRTFERPLTDAELRTWFAARGNPTGEYLDELLAAARGKSEDQLDAEYAALHGDMA